MALVAGHQRVAHALDWLVKVFRVSGSTETIQAVALVDANGDHVTSLGGGGDATAANQTTEIARLDTLILATDTLEASFTTLNAKVPALGQALEAASVPVVLTAAQITTLTPPAAITGYATLAEQQTQTASLSVLDDWDESDRAKVNPIVGQAGLQGGAGAVSANTIRAVLATDQTTIPVTATQSGTWNITNVSGTVSLPTGAATSALQTQPGVDIGDVTINNAAGASAVNIQDGGNSITVDGSVSATVSGTVTANIGTISTIATETTLSTLNGKVTACNTGAVTISAALPAGTNAIGKLAANSGVDIGDVDVTSITLPTGSATLSDSSQNVTTAGTRVQLTGAACKKIIITAKAANTGTIWVGGSTIAANRGIPLVALQNITLEVSNVNVVYIDSTVNGEGITYAYLS